MNKSTKKKKFVNYSKWGYIFLLPFFITYLIFGIIPLLSTFYYSFFKYFWANGGLKKIGPDFIGLENFKTLISSGEFAKYFGNTMIMWIIGFIPQILFALLLAVLFTSNRLKLKGQPFFKTVIYMPNLIMASALSMLVFRLFSPDGPINQGLESIGVISEPIRYFSLVAGSRGIIGGMNFLMWFGNTTIILMAGIMGIDQGLFEAAYVDGARSWQVFKTITVPLLKPILSYTLVTSLIGGIQMFDVPQILTKGDGTPDKTTMSLIMLLNRKLQPSMNYGSAGALSILLFIITAILSVIVYRSMQSESGSKTKNSRKGAKA